MKEDYFDLCTDFDEPCCSSMSISGCEKDIREKCVWFSGDACQKK